MIPSNAGFIDKNITYPIANLFVDHLHNIGLTPNMVTTITLLFDQRMAHPTARIPAVHISKLLSTAAWQGENSTKRAL